MAKAHWRRRDPLKLVALALPLAFVLIGTLQYHWLREVADAQRARLRADSATRATAIAEDFDRELTRAFLLLQLDAETVRSRDGSHYAERYEQWQQKAKWPGLVAGVFACERADDGSSMLLRYSPERRQLEPIAWPAELVGLQQRLELTGGALEPVQPDVPALVAPVTEVMSMASPAELQDVDAKVRHLMIRRSQDGAPRRCSIVLLDAKVLAARVWPELMASRLGSQHDAEYDGSVVDTRSGATLFGRTNGPGDARADLLRLHLDDLDSAILGSFVPEALRHAGHSGRVSFRFIESLHAGDPPASAIGRWRVVLRHRSGSVEHAVKLALMRNLAVAFSVLLVLAGGVVLMGVSARRARQLAERQMEFVGAVSHELRTPLAVIRSAGENLADGVIADPAHIRRYGALVRDEGERLSGMVEQVLSFAGADAPALGVLPVDVAQVVQRAVDSELRDAGGLELERSIPAGLPPVLGNAEALERAVANLIANARKHGADGRYVGIQVRTQPADAPREIAITVSDRGPGIEAADRQRLFEAFFRGRRAREEQLPGSGLGLAIVRRVAERHGGHVELAPATTPGTSFTLVLPIATDVAPDTVPNAQTHTAG